MPVAALGTAQLFGAVSADAAGELLDAAWDAGFRAFDTAPLYGRGRSEVVLGERLAGWPQRPQLTSKVGLEPPTPGSRRRQLVRSVAGRMPPSVRDRLRPGDGVPRGAFDPGLVGRSLDRTLLRLGYVDRLMLHEAHAEDLDDEMLTIIGGFRDRGDVGSIGVATVNEAAAAVARRAPELVTAAHVEVGPFAAAVELPATVTTVVGHGTLGPGASGLRRLAAWAAGDDGSALRWTAATAGTRWAGTEGIAGALVARAAALPLTDVIVATSRRARLPGLRELASGEVRMPDDIAASLEMMVTAARRANR